MSRKIYLAISLVLAGGLVAAWYFLAHSKQSVAENNGDTPDLGPEAPISVKVQYARQGTLVLRLTATGYTRAIRQVPFTAQVAGVVDSLSVYEGKKVSNGELLLKINDADYRLAVAEAREQFNQAIIAFGERRVERTNPLARSEGASGNPLDLQAAEKAFYQAQADFAAGKISEEKLLIAKSDYEAAKLFQEGNREQLLAMRTGVSRAAIALQRAELNLSHTRLAAPFPSVVANLKVNLGQPLATGAECLTLVNLDTMLIDVEILESEAPQVEMGRNATATFAAFPDETFRGKVVAINPLVDVEKRVRRAIVAIASRDHRLIPGLYAQVKIESQFLTNRLIVPKEAIVLRDQRKVVFIVRGENEGETGGRGEREMGEKSKGVNGRFLAKWCYVETGAENEEEVEVLSSAFNLQAGEAVVVTNHFTMAHDTPVRVEE